MASTVPGGAYLDDQGRPKDANGERLDPLPDTLSVDEREKCREAGLVSQKQVRFYSADQLVELIGLEERTALLAKGKPVDGGPLEGIEFASDAASDLALESGLAAEDFSGVEPSGETGYTKPDIEELTE
jgi:hypothetical protein